MTLAEKLGSYTESYWDFTEYRNDTPLVRYPAVMVAPMQGCILKEIITSDNSINEVLDPFCGSGTVLSEGKKLGLNVKGFDINPLATLITQVQLEGIPSESSSSSIEALFARLTLLLGNVKPYYFRNIKKWFNDDVILSLSVIREAILGEKDARTRRFFWCCFAETIKKFSNTRTSTFKLHLKEAEQVESLVDDSIEFFKNHIRENARKMIGTSDTKTTIYCGDSIDLLAKLPENSVDLICTSPPYGDNHTTVTYGQFSVLPLLWIDVKDIMLWDTHLLETFTAIDTFSLGGRVKREKNIHPEYNAFVEGIAISKQAKVISFLSDYEDIFKLLARSLKPEKLLVLTLGNRRVDNKEIQFDVFNDMLAQKYGMEIDSTITRNIVGKRMPSKVSNVKECGAVKSMSKEYVKIYRKRATNHG